MQTLTRKAKTISHHTPHISSLCNLTSRLLKVAAHKHLATREDNQHITWIYVWRYLPIQHREEILQGHILFGNIRTAVATAVTAMEITTKRTLPEECTQLMSLHNAIVDALEEL